jgi:hypothetical protein
MILATRTSPSQIEIGRGDIRTIQRHRTWAQFQHLQQGFEHVRGIRLSYYDGTVEILMPGRSHELFKSVIGILIETFLLDREFEFEPTGSMTQELEGVASVEAWLWEDGVLDVYHLQSGGYEQVSHSLIPELLTINLTVLSECISVGETSRVDAVKRFRSAHPLA